MRTIIINENAANSYVKSIISESFVPSSEQVRIIKQFLDKNFKKQYLDGIDANGYPNKTPMVWMMSGNTQLKQMTISELLLMLDDKFNRFMKDDKDRKEFLKQVIRDWMNGSISKDGLLSKNFL